MIQGKHILLGVSGGIAAYKAPLLVRQLKSLGADVRVVMTRAAKEFTTTTTLQALSGHPVRIETFDEAHEQAMGHIELARWADYLLIAPATANIIAKLAMGLADDLLSTLALATQAPLMLAPAMNTHMWAHPSVQANIALLKQRQAHILPTAYGEQACGDIGYGRMWEPEHIVDALMTLAAPKPWAGVRVLISAGPTHEPIDPVRYIGNRSSGLMGYALAQVAKAWGAEVTLVSGPTHQPVPAGVNCVPVTTAQEMMLAVMDHIQGQDLFISAAAVGDYRVSTPASQKIKKHNEPLTLTLIENEDILAKVSALPHRPVCVGFAAESEHVLEYARAKLAHKRCDMICANDIAQPGIGFEAADNAVTLITATDTRVLAKQSKQDCAKQILQYTMDHFLQKRIAHVHALLPET